MFSYCVIHEAWDCVVCQNEAIEAMPPGARLFLNQIAMEEPAAADSRKCLHRGTLLSVAPCCGQMFACNLYKGKKCAPVGIAKYPFLSCSTCDDFKPVDGDVSDE